MDKENGTETPRDRILQTLRTKSSMKQDVHRRTIAMFDRMKELLQEIAVDLEREILDHDNSFSGLFCTERAEVRSNRLDGRRNIRRHTVLDDGCGGVRASLHSAYRSIEVEDRRFPGHSW